MKYFLLTILNVILLLFLSNSTFAQEFGKSECGLEEGAAIIEKNFDDLAFFPTEACGAPLYIECRFVFFTRDDGTGTFPEGDPETLAILDEYVNRMNAKLSNIRDTEGCAPDLDYPYDSNVRLKVTYDYISDAEAWDYHARATAMGPDFFNQLYPFCPSSIDVNDPSNSTWPHLRQVIRDYHTQYPNTVNFFFIEDGNLIETVENLIVSGNTPDGPYTEDFPMFSGCSRLPASYYSDRNQFIIMADFYSDWLARKNFGTYYFPDHADAGNETIAGWHLSEMPGITVHELGHKIMNMFHRSSCNNIMHSSGAYRTYLDFDQLNDIHSNLMTTNLHKFVSCEDVSEETCDLIIDHDLSIDDPMSIYGDLIIEEDVTLTITSEVYLSKESSIDLLEGAKLIVNGGLLTNHCDERWKGIRVTGGNSDFDVKLENAVIENARKAVSLFPPLPWPEMSNHGNGIVHADNTTFNNVGRLAELISFQPAINHSYFKNCTQNGGVLGITNWNCQFVEITDNTFNNISKHSIVTEGGSFVIEGNIFNSGENDILFANVSAGIGSTIKDNEFNSDDTGLRALGTTFDRNEIQENEFQAGTHDIWMEGDNFYEISNNNLNSIIGVVSANSGNATNKIFQNSFKNDIAGILPAGNNADLIFTENCFETAYADAYITGQIATIVSNGNGPANNCFTHQGNPNADIFDLGGSPEAFTYIRPSDQNIDCLDPVLAHANVNIIAYGAPKDVCATAGNGNISDPGGSSYCNPDNTIAACENARTWLQAAIAGMQPSSSNQPNLQLNHYERCLKNVERQLFELYLLSNLSDKARAMLVGNISDDDRVSIYSSYLFEGNLVTATNYLTSIQNPSDQLADFIKVQMIQLARLNFGPHYTASSDDLDVLKTIAVRDHAYATYAKSLFFALTNVVLSSDIPDLQGKINEKDYSIETIDFDIKKEGILVYPNPVTTFLHIETPAYENLEVEIVDVRGNVVFRGSIMDDILLINTFNWGNGMYYLRLIEDEETIYHNRFIVNK